MAFLSTQPYKGVRDFYPEDMALQRYIFDTWAKTAESFGYQRYDASIFEPSDLYRSKGSENTELVNEQTYTFIDRGDREVTLRPEITPTVARMVAARHQTTSFPLRWYSIPNLFRYERPQRGRLREFWQLNADILGSDDIVSDIEIISLAYATLTGFGATPDMFTIHINDRSWLDEEFAKLEMNTEQIRAMYALLDRKNKITDFDEQAEKILGKPFILTLDTPPAGSRLEAVISALADEGITNVVFSPAVVRGFNYYTGIVFEIFDTHADNTRALLGGGRYDNLTGLFVEAKIPGTGFGMGDVAMRDFLVTHQILNVPKNAPDLVIIPMEVAQNIAAHALGTQFRIAGIKTLIDFGTRKLSKKLTSATESGTKYAIIIGENDVTSQTYTLKNLTDITEISGTAHDLIQNLKLKIQN